MLIDDYKIALVKRRSDLESGVFNQSPKTIEDFREFKGIWLGLGEALSILDDIKKKERFDD